MKKAENEKDKKIRLNQRQKAVLALAASGGFSCNDAIEIGANGKTLSKLDRLGLIDKDRYIWNITKAGTEYLLGSRKGRG